MAADLTSTLQDLARGLAGAQDDPAGLAALAAGLTGADSSSVLLVDGEDRDARMSIVASFGPLAPAAQAASVGRDEGIAGHVLASGSALLVHDILQSPYAHLARRPDDPRRGLMVVPLRIDGRAVGTLNASCCRKGCFNDADLALMETVATGVARALQVRQLRGILASRFTQLALAGEVPGNPGGTAYRKPDQVARLLARSFYREMAKAGFESRQIVQAASEIIDQLNGELSAQLAGQPAGQPGKRRNGQAGEPPSEPPGGQPGPESRPGGQSGGQPAGQPGNPARLGARGGRG